MNSEKNENANEKIWHINLILSNEKTVSLLIGMKSGFGYSFFNKNLFYLSIPKDNR